jgi:hypothetical protein
MTEKKTPEAPMQDAPKPAPPAGEKPDDQAFHHHDHMVIRPPSTGVTHLDPGVVMFS